MMHRNPLRRALLVLLLVLLPAQFAWAAVSSYCQHEAGAAPHLGHHEHQHKADERASGGQSGPAGGAWDPDCGTCHAAGLAFACAARSATVLKPRGSVFPLLSALPRFSPADRPEKPNWLSLA